MWGGGRDEGRYTTDAEIHDSLQNVKKHSMNNFSFESEKLEKRTMWASFYHCESFRIMVLHSARKSLAEIQKSWEMSRCWAPLNQAKEGRNLKLCARCKRWWCSAAPTNCPSLEGVKPWRRRKSPPDFLNECAHFYKRYSYKEKKPSTRQILLMLHLKWSV